MVNLSEAPFTDLAKPAPSEIPDRFLEAKFYTDPSLVSLEQQRIFHKTWLYVGHGEALAQPGSALITEVAGHKVLISRPIEAPETLKAFHNVCSHRAAPLQIPTKPCSRPCVICPYHGWVYDLEGRLICAPQRKHFPKAFDIHDFPLKPIRVEQFGPFIFVCLDAVESAAESAAESAIGQTVPPLLTYLGHTASTLAAYPLGQMQQLVELDSVVACNWKTFHDNSLCDYHVDIAHGQTLKDTQGTIRSYRYHFDQYTNCLVTPLTKTWQTENSSLVDLPESIRTSFFTFGIFPNLHIFVLPNGALYLERIDPLSVDTCRVHTEIYGIPEFTPPAAELAQWYGVVLAEDTALVEGVQKGYASGVYTAGIANDLESRILHQQNLFRQFMANHLPL